MGRPNLFWEEPRGPYYAPLMPGAMKGANENLNCEAPRVLDSGASQAPQKVVFPGHLRPGTVLPLEKVQTAWFGKYTFFYIWDSHLKVFSGILGAISFLVQSKYNLQ